MTRETKIGLLVGLAFIIVIGILLSDHLTSSTEPPQAALAGAGNSVRSAVTVPGQPGPQPPAVTPPVSPAPQNPVPTQSELTPAPSPVLIVNTPRPGGSAQQQSPITIVNDGQSAAPIARNEQQQQQQPAVAQASATDTPPTITHVPDPATSSNNPMANVARQHGEELVPVSPNGSSRTTSTLAAATAARNGVTEYKAQAGDSLSKMAGKFMGANTKANRDAIVAMNASLKEDPNKVVVGRTYIIPTAAANVSTQAPAAAPAPTEMTTSVAQQQTAPAPTGGVTEYFYTVKENDSLWKIATEQCGRAGAVAAIKELNLDVLKGENHDVVIVGTKLRLPGKPVASATN